MSDIVTGPNADNLKALNNSLDPNYVEKINESVKKGLVNYKNYSGVGNKLRPETVCNFEQAEADKVLAGSTNSMIILGNDRDAGLNSGYGGIGQTAASSIDLIAGLAGSRPLNNINGQQITTGKNFETDSARIYISQFSNIDEYFSLPEYKTVLGTTRITLSSSKAKSGIGIKADNIRVIARENIRLVTNHLGLASTNEEKYRGGIEIIAGYDVPDQSHLPQPMVKGDNLIEFLKELINVVEKVQITVNDFLEVQQKINLEFFSHRHQSNSAGLLTDAMVNNKAAPLNLQLINKSLPEILSNYAKMVNINADYFKAGSRKYINSMFNKVN